MLNKEKLKTKNAHTFRRFNQRKLKKINDIYIQTHIVIQGLSSLNDNPTKMTTRKGREVAICINMPSTREGRFREITRSQEELRTIITERMSEKEFVQSIIVAVSLTEDYIADIIRLILEAYPKKLTFSQKGGAQSGRSKTINLSDLLDYSSMEEVIKDQVEKRVQDLLYASPKQYADYISSVAGIEIGERLIQEYAEVKATRDLYVHGDGKVNELYLKKSEQLARGDMGEKATVDSVYFDHAIRVMKELFTKLFTGLREEYHSDSNVERVLESRGCHEV